MILTSVVGTGQALGQVWHTVHGCPVANEQIDLIAAAVAAALTLGPDDLLLDLACGNGALSDRMFERCAGGVGVDASEYLVGVAQECFATPSRQYVMADVADWAETEADPGRFTKAVCHGSFSYLPDGTAARMLRALRRRFPRLGCVLLGDLPDPARAGRFRGVPGRAPGETGRRSRRAPDPRALAPDLGTWRDEAEITTLAGPGWQVTTRPMPPESPAAPPRYNAILMRR